MTDGKISAEVRGMSGRMEFGTERTREMLARLGFPEKSYKIIHIAGTNGKGSVAEYMTEILISAGKRTGTFTSPEVTDFNGQFRVNGKPISFERMEECFAAAKHAGEGLSPTGFELQTAGALLAFKEEGCEYAVIECGLGGLNDATNAVSSKSLALITSVSLEHTSFLGNTVAEICAQKAGIIRGCPAVVGSLQCDEGRNYFGKLGVSFADKPLKIIDEGLDGTRFSYGGEKYFLKIHGGVQPYNAALAAEGARRLGIAENAIKEGLSRAALTGRLQTLKRRGKLYVVDGAHNPASFVPLAEFLKKFTDGQDAALIFGCLSDKDIGGCLQKLEGLVSAVFAVKPSSPRAMDIEKISSACARRFKKVEERGSVAEALAGAAEYGTAVVCGSFTLVKEALEWIEKG